MRTDEFLRLLREVHAATSWGENFDPDDEWLFDLEGLDELMARIAEFKQALAVLQRTTEARMADELQLGSVRLGEWVYRHRPSLTTRITDPKGLADWLADDWSHVVPVTSSTTLRKGGVDAVCEKRGIDPEMFWDTFTVTEQGDPRVERLPVGKAPKFIQASADGEIVGRPKGIEPDEKGKP